MMMFETSKHVPKTKKRCCLFKNIFHFAEQCMGLLIEQLHAKHTGMFISVVLDGSHKGKGVQLVSSLMT